MDFRKNVYAMGGALISTSVAAVILLLLFAKTFGWDFYYAANNAYWSGAEDAPVSTWPYPGLLAAFFFGEDFATWTHVLGIPLLTVAAGAFAIFLAFCLYQWVSRSVYGINDPSSFLYLGVLYVLTLALCVVFRLIRRAQGMDLNMVYSEIPED